MEAFCAGGRIEEHFDRREIVFCGVAIRCPFRVELDVIAPFHIRDLAPTVGERRVLENLISQVKPRLASIGPPAGTQKRVNARPRPVGRACRPMPQALDVFRRLGNRLIERLHHRPELRRECKPARFQHA